jgi:heme-degrading monooxygenase HmoA
MHARVTTTKGPPQSVDQATQVVREQVLPRARELPGFKGMLTVADRKTGNSFSVTLWESEEAMAASDEAADAMRGQAIGAIEGSEVVSVDRYEVTIDERS